MLLFQIICIIVGLIGIWYSVKKIIFHGKKTDVGELGNVLVWLIVVLIFTIIFATSVTFIVFV